MSLGMVLDTTATRTDDVAGPGPVDVTSVLPLRK
jgi:hypothetical protein